MEEIKFCTSEGTYRVLSLNLYNNQATFSLGGRFINKGRFISFLSARFPCSVGGGGGGVK